MLKMFFMFSTRKHENVAIKRTTEIRISVVHFVLINA